jgi:hypothetical protein
VYWGKINRTLVVCVFSKMNTTTSTSRTPPRIWPTLIDRFFGSGSPGRAPCGPPGPPGPPGPG